MLEYNEFSLDENKSFCQASHVGCGCCGGWTTITKELLQEQIKELEELLLKAKEIESQMR